MPAAAVSRSARAVTMQGFLPPSSAMHGLAYGPAIIWRASRMPTSTEPVKVRPAVAS